MNTLIFVSIAVMQCNWTMSVIDSGYHPDQPLRCVYGQEIIVKADQLQVMKEKKYLLGPISKQEQLGCVVTLSSGDKLFSGKPCRRLMGEK